MTSNIIISGSDHNYKILHKTSFSVAKSRVSPEKQLHKPNAKLVNFFYVLQVKKFIWKIH